MSAGANATVGWRRRLHVVRICEDTRRQRGFTLLEVVLALSLSVLVLGALSMAIHVNLRATTSGHDDVQQAQLARALLGRMADDIRGAVWYAPVGEPWSKSAAPSGDDAAAGGESGSGGGGAADTGGGGSSSGGGSSEGSSASGGSSTSDGASSSSADSSTAPTSVTGIYGGANWIELDIGRLPNSARAGVAQAGGLVPTPESDLRRVLWFLSSAPVVGVDAAPPIAPDGAEGLLRREWDSAVARWLGTVAAETARQSTAALAPEVVTLEFRYYDGTQWVYQWDTLEQGGLPALVEIGLALASAGDRDEAGYSAPTTLDSAEQAGLAVFRTIVAPPVAPASASGASSGGSDSSTNGDSSTTGGSSSAGSSSSSSSGS